MCAANIDALGPANTCSTLNTTIAGLYSSTFSNANASIYIQYGITGLGPSSQFQNFVTYSSYVNALAAENGPGTVRAAALATTRFRTRPLQWWRCQRNYRARSCPRHYHRCFWKCHYGYTVGGSTCTTVGSNGCYDAVITLATPASLSPQGYYYRSGAITADEYDIFSVAEHETDEVLGTSSCIDKLALRSLTAAVAATSRLLTSTATTVPEPASSPIPLQALIFPTMVV